MRSKFMFLLAVLTLAVYPMHATAQIVLGTAEDFAVLGASKVDNTGMSVVKGGHVGVWPTMSIIGFPPGVVVPPHIIHNANAVAETAQANLTNAYNTAAGLPPTQVLTGIDLGGLTLPAGVYFYASSAQLTGTLTLDAEGDPDAVFVFQMGSTLTTASNSSVVLINGAQACNVYWQVGSSATLGTDTTFIGNIMAQASITLTTRVKLTGRALARTAAITMDTNDISVVICDCEVDGDCAGATPFCDTTTGLCVECLDDINCDDGLFCNGDETCAEGACQAGTDPCLPGACDEANDDCFACVNDVDCPPGAPFCDPVTNECVECIDDLDCDDGDICTIDACVANVCVYSCADAATVGLTADCGNTDITISCEEIVPDYLPTFTDNCAAPLTLDFVSTDTAGVCPQEFTIVQSVTATVAAADDCDIDANCTRTVNVVDDDPPTITCPANTSVSCEDPRTPAETGEATATDLCDPSVTVDHEDQLDPGGCVEGELTIIRTWTATDACGNESMCDQIITVFDNTAPVITCPEDVTVECDESTEPANTGTASATDNCDPAPVVDFTDDSAGLAGCNGTGTITRTWTATDDCGRSATCDQVITVVDSTPPEITCPEDAILECGDSTVPSVLYGTATGGVMIRYNDDTETPENQAYLKVQFSQTNDNGAAFEFSDAPLTGSGFTWAQLYGSGEQFGFDLVLERPSATIVIPYTNAYDNVDNTIAGRALVGPVRWAINDYKPNVGGPAVETNEVINSLIRSVSPPNLDPDVDIEIVSLNLTSVDPFTLTISGVLHSDGTHHWFGPATPDSPMANFNLNGDFYFFGTLIYDPNADVTADGDFYEGTIHIYANSPSVQLGIALATDNCDLFPVVTFTDDLSGLTECSETGTFTRTWMATDGCGRSATCDQVITVVDTTPPEITCPPDQNVECGDLSALEPATATDLCDTSTITPTFEDEFGDGGCDDIMRTWTAMDACGNENSCVQTLSVIDEAPPTVGDVAPLDACYPTCEAFQEAAEAAVLAAATDNCPFLLSLNSDVNCEDCNGTADIAVVDACGNSSEPVSLSATIDDEAPTATCETTESEYVLDGNCEATVEFTGAITDNCCVDIESVMVSVIIQSGAATVTFDQNTDCTIEFRGDGNAGVLDTIVDVSCSIQVSGVSECPLILRIELTADDCCGNPMETVCSDTAEIVDTIIFSCPEPITLERGDMICSDEVQNWLDMFTAESNCFGELTSDTDAPECGFPAGTTTTVTFTPLDACASEESILCESTITILPEPRVTGTAKGSLLIFSKVEIKWNADGTQLLQDTFLDVSNDFPAGVMVQAYFINGDTELAELGDNEVGGPRDFEPGWNTADCRFSLTANQPHYWSAANGSDKCQPFTVLDSDGPGRPDPETSGAERILRGYVVMWAVRFNEAENIWEEIRWNHLKGDAVLVNYANKTAWEYNAWAASARCGLHGDSLLDCILRDDNGTCCEAEVIPGQLDLDGFQLDIAFGSLLLDFYASGTTALSGGNVTASVNTDLTLHPVTLDLRQDGGGPVLTKVEAEIWNENENKFSGTRRCICCWDQTLLSDWSRSEAIPNHFLLNALGTDKGTARLTGVASFECDYREICGIEPRRVPIAGFNSLDLSRDASLLGLATKFIAFSGGVVKYDTAGMNLVGVGRAPATIIHDVTPITDGQELNLGKDLRSSPRRPTR
jgi:hypothetical protein